MVNNNKVYIHLGLHKTGSTFFQKKFYPMYSEFNYKHLRDASTLSEFNQYILRENALTFSLEHAKTLFYKHLSPNETEQGILTLCEEQFSGFPLQDALNRKMIFDRLLAFFPNANFVIVLRNQKDFVKSMYAEYLKKGGTATLKNFLTRKDSTLNFSRGSYLKYFDYYNCIKNRVTEKKVKVLYYEDLNYNPELFFNELNSFFNLNLSISESILNAKENVSFKSEFFNSVRFYNIIGKTPYGKDHLIPTRFKNKIIKMHRSFSKKNTELDEQYINQFLDSFEFKNNLLPQYDRVNKYGY